MVLATKKAVGFEYGYPVSNNHPVRKKQQQIKTRTKKRNSPVVGVVLIVALFATGLSYTYLKALKAQHIWQVQQMKSMNMSLQNENEKLQLEKAKLKSLDRIEQIAGAEMKMVKNPQVEYLAFTQVPAQEVKENPTTINKEQISQKSGNNIIMNIATYFFQ